MAAKKKSKRYCRKAWILVKHDMSYPGIMFVKPAGFLPTQNVMPVEIRQTGRIYGLTLHGRKVKPLSDKELKRRYDGRQALDKKRRRR